MIRPEGGGQGRSSDILQDQGYAFYRITWQSVSDKKIILPNETGEIPMEFDHSIRKMTGIIALLTKLIYFVTAVILSILALISFIAAGLQFLTLLGPGDITGNLLQVLHAILLTIIIVEILETITAYFKTSRVLVRPILVAGLTAMVRRVLVLGVETINPTETLVTVAVIAVLTAAVVLVGKEELQEEKSE
jgi:uncharacterized membrane protein (DUF373 family)